ncbi:hypothetical protein [Anaeromyxobacter sp. SG66]|uniref:hypothetical protein n=1 Tax=Anaeromyxobacter sp. SG66 TaxID=2925410 RepID=UPI001F56A809|nr:hypothetical protein [Anaeromyxobacter sp. SG66]
MTRRAQSSLPATALVAAVVTALAAPGPAEGIPAFARRYRFSCTTCHAPFPRLKPYGEQFAGRGFALEPGAEPARSTLDLGDPLLELPREFPLALRFDAFGTVSDRSPELDFETPWTFKLLAGGRIADKIGFYAYYILEQGEPGKIEDAYLQFSEVFGLPVNVLAGQFQVSDPIAKRELRLERLDYQILKTRVGESGVDLTYDRGVALTSDVGPVAAVATVTNGSGIGAVEGGRFDTDSYKNVSLHLAGDVGPVRLAGFGYWGRERRGGVNDTIVYWGPHVGVGLTERVQLSAVYLERRDSNPRFGPRDEDLVTRGGFVEALAFPTGPDGRIAVVALYNLVRSDDDAADAESGALTLQWLYRRNVRITAEVDRDFDGDAWTGSLGTIAAF